jgi:hypothetical protein
LLPRPSGRGAHGATPDALRGQVPNVDVLASVVSEIVAARAALIFLLGLSTLVALRVRGRSMTLGTGNRDPGRGPSRSMQAEDVAPTRLGAAQAISTFSMRRQMGCAWVRRLRRRGAGRDSADNDHELVEAAVDGSTAFVFGYRDQGRFEPQFISAADDLELLRRRCAAPRLRRMRTLAQAADAESKAPCRSSSPWRADQRSLGPLEEQRSPSRPVPVCTIALNPEGVIDRSQSGFSILRDRAANS